MLQQQALNLPVTTDPVVTDALRAETADRVVAALEEHRKWPAGTRP